MRWVPDIEVGYPTAVIARQRSLSKVVTLEIEGRPISDDEAVSYATVILFGGLEMLR